MSSYKPIDSKREEFRKYLERTGVMDALTKALVALYEEIDKPDDALGYVRSYLGGPEELRAMQKDKMDLAAMKEGGDQPGSSRKNESTYKSDSMRPMGAEGDGPLSKNPTSEDGGTFDDGGKNDDAPIPADGAI